MNTFQYAHYIARQDKADGSRLSYADLFRLALHKAYRMPSVRQYDYSALEADIKQREAIIKRCKAEKAVVMAAVMRGIRLGYAVSVYDGEEWAVKRSTDVKVISDSLQSTDADRVLFVDQQGKGVGSLWAFYGNSAGEVIADHTISPTMDLIMAPAERAMEQYAERGI
ncbi:hypothetical protein QE320_gp070 [Pseudomonas phage EM]|uniref:Uncharacterized protein n=1 Tax=Pseudomonas phage EM TaxID=2936914 RepID=A0AAE9HJ64_9CAUD|nr:hypothetical protein QE320_gp070 [Pseudomonas phage EM]UPW35984.1 hypothetical protein EM_199 [Pseudomonas phage EM]